MSYSLAQFVSEINSLGTETVYPYASLSGHSTSSCKLVSVDSNSGAIKFTRNGGAQVEKISGANVSKLVEALATNKAVEMNSLFGGSGNARSVLEAFVVHTPHVFLCKIDGKKHIYYSHDKSHPSGQIEIDTSPNVSVYSGAEKGRKADDLGLVVGMRSAHSPNGVVTIIDDDDYSYQVRCVNDSKHSEGIRTLSKILVREWIDAVRSDPNKNASTIRVDLCGKSDIDKFEYGNDAVLYKLAKMATGQSPHTLVDVSEYWSRRVGRAQRPAASAADLLTVALKLFAEKRSIDKPGGVWESYNAWTKSVRSEFVSVDESLLSNSAFNYLEYIRKYTVSGFVANTSFARHSSDEKCEVLKFLKSQKDSPKSASWYIDVANRLVIGGNQVDGMTPKSLLYFMSELHPEEFAAWTEPTYEQLEFLGLHKGAAPSDLTIETYEDCKAKQQLIVAKMKELKIGKASDDPSAPDYRTANEFLWWLGQDDNKNLIKEKVMSKAMKKDKFKKYEGKKELELNSASKDDQLLLRLLASLRAKPFAILAGHSGTGKSRYVKKIAYMTCNAEELRNENQLPGNYLLLQVKPNWHDSTDLLGFRNAMVGGAYQKTELIKFLFKAYHFSETPFFLCLDEMNLAPVEQYFAEFLSAMESKEPVPLNDISEKDANLFELGCEWEDSLEYLKKNGFSIPKNLFIVGTVNMDETTNQFSRKVLDRAFTIEMTDVDFTNYGNVTDPSYGDTLKPAIIESLLNGEKAVSALDEEDKKADSSLVKVQKALASTPFAIAYRFANEYTLLKRAIECFDADGKMKLDALDQAVLMKILPRIAGERDYIEKVYGEKENEGLRGALEGKQVSLSKISEILKRAKDTNSLHITFWP